MFRSYGDFIRYETKSKQPRTLESYSCDLCDQSTWLSETDVQLHRKDSHFSEIREQMQNHLERFCTICMTLQDSHSALISHVKTRHLLSSSTARRVERQIYICMHCDHIFFNKGLLEAHIMYLHLWSTRERSTKTFTCPKCKKVCKLKFIWFHMQLHEIPSLSICEICLTHFPNMKELNKHLKNHSMFYKCEICNYHTSKERHFESHLEQHHNSPLKKGVKIGKLAREVFGRINSNSSCNSMMKYNTHHSLRGLDLPKFMHICTLCREICTDKIEAKLHLIRDHLKEEEMKKKFICTCGEEFFNRVLLKHHTFKMKGFHQELDGIKQAPKVVATQTSPMETADVEIDHIGTPDDYVIQLEDIEPEMSQETEMVIDIDMSSDTEDPNEVPNKTNVIKKQVPITKNEVVGTEVPVKTKVVFETGVPIEIKMEGSQKTAPGVVSNEESKEDLTYIYAEICEDQLVTIDSETNEEIIGF